MGHYTHKKLSNEEINSPENADIQFDTANDGPIVFLNLMAKIIEELAKEG
jgi:hypothetical protein